MKQTELRIGNYIEYSGKQGIVVSIGHRPEWITFNQYNQPVDFAYEASLGLCKGILITRELLLKFGFEPNGPYKSMRIPISTLTKESPRTFIVCTFDGEGWIEIISKQGSSTEPKYFDLQTHIIELKYVHQLQNIYFVLTGQELIIKNT